MTPTMPLLRAGLALTLLALAVQTPAADRREKVAVMKVDAPDLNRSEVASVRDRLEVGVARAVGNRLQVITKDSAAASVGGGDRLLACMEGASCDAEIGGALGVDYFVSASVRQTPLGFELGVTLLRIGRDVSLLNKEMKAFATLKELLDGTSRHAEAVTREALGGVSADPTTQGVGIGAADRGAAGGAADPGMMRISGGAFRVGHVTLTLDHFALDVTPVTVGAFDACVRAGRCVLRTTVNLPDLSDEARTELSRGCHGDRRDRWNHPANCVDWDNASSYCAWINKRLPTIEERTWAARGADLSGNVREWTSSAGDSGRRKLGGSSYAETGARMMIADHDGSGADPNWRDIGIGFRCARSL
jgi:hypothetical protein